ncbi:MAG TPA: methionyl-tRNA formyltransferase [Caulobacteraceae bacterium]
MRLAFLGTPDFAVPTLAALIDAGHEIVRVYSQPPAARGRGHAVRPSAVHAYALDRGLEVATPVSMRAGGEIAAFRVLGADAAVVVAFGQILAPEVLEAPRLGCFNLHASLLPRWRGAAPIARAIMAGDSETGACVMRMSEGLDEGPVLDCARLPIGALDTAGILHDALASLGARLMADCLADVSRGAAIETSQPTQGATYARKLKAVDTRIVWERPAAMVDRQIRGLSPFPGAWFAVSSPRGPVRVRALLSCVEDANGAAGTVLDDRLLIACGTGAVRILRGQREGRGVQDGEALVRGFAVPAGSRLT